MKLTIIVPVLNEREIIKESLIGLASSLKGCHRCDQCEVVVVDAGSTDGTDCVARAYCEVRGWCFTGGRLTDPSIGKTIQLGLMQASGDYVLLLPCDCRISSAGMRELMEACSQQGQDYGGFYKVYVPDSFGLRVYASLQNLLRTALLKNLVWTNGIWFRRSLVKAEKLPCGGFLEDVQLSDLLKRQFQIQLLSAPIEVSARRYTAGSLRRILINLVVIGLYRVGFRDVRRLRRFYQMF